MSRAELPTFASTLAKTHVWLREIRGDLGWADPQDAYLALKGVLHAVRDRLPVDEAVQLGAQLPMLIRGFYYEGWRATGKPLGERHEDEFLTDALRYFGRTERLSLTEFAPGRDAEAVARAVFGVLARHTTEAATVRSLLPSQIRALWPADGRAPAAAVH